MGAVGRDAERHRAVDRGGVRLAFDAGRRDDADLADDLALLRIAIGHVVHVGPVEGERRLAGGEHLADILLQVFARVRVGQAVLQALLHIADGVERAAAGEVGLAVVEEAALVGVDQGRVVADDRLGLRPAPDDREFDDALVLEDLGLLGQLLPGLGRRGDAGLFQHFLVIEEVLGVENPRHAPALAVILDRRPGAVEDLGGLVGGNAGRDVLDEPVLGELGRPDHVDQHAVITRRPGALGGDDLVVQRLVGHELEIDLDPGVRLLEVGRHVADVVLAVGRLLHEQRIQRHVGRAGRQRATQQHQARRGSGRRQDESPSRMCNHFAYPPLFLIMIDRRSRLRPAGPWTSSGLAD